MATGPPSTQNAAMLKHYRMNDLFPVTWEDASSSGQVNTSRPSSSSSTIQRQGIVGRGHTRNTSRYSVLQEEGALMRAKRASRDSNASRVSLGLESNLPQDEPDPLGMSDSVVKVLRANGNVEVDMNLRYRNRYLISSKSFSPNHFLRDVHQNSSVGDLQNGLDYLTTSITQKSSALKQLVSNNFDRFVLAKSTIDSVYEEMKGGTMRHVKGNGDGDEADAEGEGRRADAMFRLVKEDEWGLKNTRTLLTEITNKAGVVFGPMLENRGREEKLRLMMQNLERQKAIFEISSVVVDAIKRKDYEAVKEEYFKARKAVEAARALVYPGRPPTESELHRIVVAERMWAEVEEVMEEYKRDTWRRLVDTSQSEGFLDLITMLLELGVNDNPIWVWLLSRYDYLKKKISQHFDRLRVEIELLRRRVAAAAPPSSTNIAYHLRTPLRRSPNVYDGPLVTAFWDLLVSSLSTFLSPTDGILGEVVSFWAVAQNFIDGKTQKTLPLGPEDGSSEKHHRLSEDGITQLRKGGNELISMIVKSVTTFFQDPPVEDVSLLVSPVPPDSNANTPNSSKPTTPSIQTTFPIPKRSNSNLGDKDAYSFMAAHCNSLGGTHYLAQVLGILGTAAAEMHKLPIGKGSVDGLRSMVNGPRDRMVHAMCTVWLKDCKECKVMEDWTRDADNRDVTKMPGQFLAMEGAIILGMQDMLYVTKSKAEPSNQVILPPSKSLVTFVRQQFVKSLYMALNGMIENAKSKEAGDFEEVELASPVMQVAPVNLMSYSVDKSDANVRMLLTLSNLQVIRTRVVPRLMEQFETAFGLKLTDESKSIKDALTQIDSQLFDAYTKPYAVSISRIIRTGVMAKDWEPKTRADSIKPYIHEALLELVLVHAQVTTTAPSLTGRILSYLLECMSADLLAAFKNRPQEKFGLNALLQATLDVEFVNQTLSQYGTPRARELQQDIYVELDQRSDAPARTALHKELSEMKTTLTALRRASRAEFLCFRQKKGSGSGASGQQKQG